MQVISVLVEGNTINAIVQMTGIAKHTVLKLLEDMGCACAAYHRWHVRNLRVRRLQCDEIWAFVGAKAKNIRWMGRRMDLDGHRPDVSCETGFHRGGTRNV